jgi:hypothetical protein
MIASARLATIVPALALLSMAVPALADGPRFAVYGDMPYTDADQAFLDGPASPASRADAGVDFVLSVGDLGRPEAACDDEWQVRQRRMWREGFRRPVIPTPGDNDWTDCDRKQLPHPVSELGRLDALRRIHFETPPPGIDRQWRWRAQHGQPENAMWATGGVQFATLHVVGTANGRAQIELDDRQLAWALADSRDQANRVWLAETFRAARETGAKAVVIAMQVDPFNPKYVDPGKPAPAEPLARCLASSPLAPTCRALVGEALGFAGPVLLVHGDTNPACLEPIDSADGRRLFWRLNAWGDFSSPPAIAVVDVEPGDAARPFRVSSLLDDGPTLPAACRY